ncbi:HIT domain-containing protein [Amycolatopsis sp. NPDC059027]|uniref:HIT domain-containing protein n=1 Tax=unclassified Amycolatopsis TaxID=2618356 RepID=UPI003672D675
MSRLEIPRGSDMSTRCDESGMCEIADGIGANCGTELKRLIEARADWATIVDIAPIALGHLLVFPFEHLTRAAQLGMDGFAKYWDYLAEAATFLSSFKLGPVAAVEHGSPGMRSSMSCVRHCHTHVCPIENRFHSFDRFISAVESFVDIDDVHFGWQQAYRALSRMDEYVLVFSVDSIIVGRPRPGIRQISRALLAALNDNSGICDIDWVLEAENKTYFDTLKLLKG